MIRCRQTIICQNQFPKSCRKTPFSIVRYSLNYEESYDREVVDNLIDEAQLLSEKVWRGRANISQSERSKTVVLSNCYAGVFSEFFWRDFLNHEQTVVSSTEYVSAANQIDLEIIKNKKKIEVRSSFPRNGVAFAICHPAYQFDILGPYHNSYKPQEIQKDFYVRTFFPLKSPSFILRDVKSSHFEIFLVGGATWEMMWDRNISKFKNLRPEDDSFAQEPSSYRVVPICHALDSFEMYELIKK